MLGAEMLASGKIVGFVPTKDSQKARSFYEGKLGFQFVSDDRYALVMRAGGTTIRIAKVQDFTPAPYTVLGWEVQNIAAVVTWLKERGVTLESYRLFKIASSEFGQRPRVTRLLGSRTRTETCFLSGSISSATSCHQRETRAGVQTQPIAPAKPSQ